MLIPLLLLGMLCLFVQASCGVGWGENVSEHALSTARVKGFEQCQVFETQHGINLLGGSFRIRLSSSDHLVISKLDLATRSKFASAAGSNGGLSMAALSPSGSTSGCLPWGVSSRALGSMLEAAARGAGSKAPRDYARGVIIMRQRVEVQDDAPPNASGASASWA